MLNIPEKKKIEKIFINGKSKKFLNRTGIMAELPGYLLDVIHSKDTFNILLYKIEDKQYDYNRN